MDSGDGVMRYVVLGLAAAIVIALVVFAV